MEEGNKRTPEQEARRIDRLEQSVEMLLASNEVVNDQFKSIVTTLGAISARLQQLDAHVGEAPKSSTVQKSSASKEKEEDFIPMAIDEPPRLQRKRYFEATIEVDSDNNSIQAKSSGKDEDAPVQQNVDAVIIKRAYFKGITMAHISNAYHNFLESSKFFATPAKVAYMCKEKQAVDVAGVLVEAIMYHR